MMGEQSPISPEEVGESSQKDREKEIITNQKLLKKYGFEVSDEDTRRLIESIPQELIDKLSGPEKRKIGYLVMPAQVKISDLISKIEEDKRRIVSSDDLSLEELDAIPLRSEQPYAIAFPWPEGLETQAAETDWERSNKTYLNLAERLMLILRAQGPDYYHLQNLMVILPGQIDTYVVPHVPQFSEDSSFHIHKYPDPTFLEEGEISPYEIATSLD